MENEALTPQQEEAVLSLQGWLLELPAEIQVGILNKLQTAIIANINEKLEKVDKQKAVFEEQKAIFTKYIEEGIPF